MKVYTITITRLLVPAVVAGLALAMALGCGKGKKEYNNLEEESETSYDQAMGQWDTGDGFSTAYFGPQHDCVIAFTDPELPSGVDRITGTWELQGDIITCDGANDMGEPDAISARIEDVDEDFLQLYYLGAGLRVHYNRMQ